VAASSSLRTSPATVSLRVSLGLAHDPPGESTSISMEVHGVAPARETRRERPR